MANVKLASINCAVQALIAGAKLREDCWRAEAYVHLSNGRLISNHGQDCMGILFHDHTEGYTREALAHYWFRRSTPVWVDETAIVEGGS